jgi:hypothetical protein
MYIFVADFGVKQDNLAGIGQKKNTACRHGEAAILLVSLALHPGFSRAYLAARLYYQWAMDFFTSEGITVQKK